MSDMITIVGGLGDEPRAITTSKGDPMVAFRLATQERRYDAASSQWVDGPTNWYKVQAYRHLATHAITSLHKGERVIVTGKVHLHSWDNGTKSGTDVEVVADAIGHDLRFGTTVYTKRSGRAQSDAEGSTSVSEQPDQAESSAQHESANGWSLPPGVDSGEANAEDRVAVTVDSTPF